MVVNLDLLIMLQFYKGYYIETIKGNFMLEMIPN
jgi:hypothetical protein